MDCAEALERLEEAFLGPGKLRALESDGSAAGIALRDHLSTCEGCSRELRAWRVAAQALDAATPDSVVASVGVRGRLLEAVVAEPRSMLEPTLATSPVAGAATAAARGQSAMSAVTRAALAAAAAVLLFAAGALLGGPLGLVPTPAAPPALDRAAFISAAVDRVLAQPGHRVLELHDQAGARSGTLVFDQASRELVVVSRALEPSATGREYHCFVERDGERSWVGRMVEYEGISWWAGPLDEPADAGGPGDRFLVVREGDTEPALSGGL